MKQARPIRHDAQLLRMARAVQAMFHNNSFLNDIKKQYGKYEKA